MISTKPKTEPVPALIIKGEKDDPLFYPGLCLSLRFLLFLSILYPFFTCLRHILRYFYLLDTEIDWLAYLQEVEGWTVQNDTNYVNLKGDTGPLVYPAGFMWIFRFLRYVTGANLSDPSVPVSNGIYIGQYIFILIYLVTQYLVLELYEKAKPGPPGMVLLLLLSKRIHSLYMLRLFNDCIAMLCLYIAIYLFIHRYWLFGCIVYSLGVSVKMNVLLYAPAVGFLLLRNIGIFKTGIGLILCVLVQIIVALPFLLTYPESYVSRAFEFGRVFFYKWTVNWKMIPEEVFVSPEFAKVLLGGHFFFLAIFAIFIWTSDEGNIFNVLLNIWNYAVGKPTVSFLSSSTILRESSSSSTTTTLTNDSFANNTKNKNRSKSTTPASNTGTATASSTAVVIEKTDGGAYHDSDAYIINLLWSCNYIGITFVRTIHYQFYTWYFHTIPFILWRARDIPWYLKVMVFLAIEYAYNVGDAMGAGSPFSSGVLQSCHFLLLSMLIFADIPHYKNGYSYKLRQD